MSDQSRCGTAVVIASALSHESDPHARPEAPLLKLGGQSVICHVVWQLNAAELSRVFIVVGWRGAEIKTMVQAMLSDEPALFDGLEVSYIDLGEKWCGGHTASILAAAASFDTEECAMIVGADHIIDENLLREMATSPLGDDAASVLVETDLNDMVGLPHNVMKVALRPLHSRRRIYAIGAHLGGAYGGIDVGVVTCGRAVIEELARLSAAAAAGSAEVASLGAALNKFAGGGTLRMHTTDGRMWFSVETAAAVKETEESLETSGHPHKLADGTEVRVFGTPKRVMASGGGDGSEWAEFSVAKWRSAMFTARSFFLQLFEDTTQFIGDICEQRGGASDVLLIEVGCGTGEALAPLTRHAKYCLGVDFNPKFIDFCNDNLPRHHRDHVKFLVGDAQRLEDILNDPEQVDPEWVRNTKKVVICVGNTIGIMPPEVKVNVYDQMMRVGGTDGAFVIVYWNGNKFGEACQNFYSKNPQLCGEFKGDSIDISTCTLVTPAGYRTHWTKPDEARGIFEGEIGAEIIDLVEKGNGVLVAGRLPGGVPLAPGPKLRRVSTTANIGAQLTLLPPPEKFVKGVDFASLRRYREANLRYRLGSPWGSKGELAALCEVDADGRPKPMLENRSVDIGPVTVPSPKLAHNGGGANGHAANGHSDGHRNGTNGHAAPALPDAVTDGIEPETPSRKQHFGDIYVEATPVSFKTRIMDELDYVCDDYTRSEFERLGSDAFCASVPGGCRYLDLCCCFGNTTMALVHGMSVKQIKANWADTRACARVASPRRFAARVTGIDLSASAVAYGKSAGILDRPIQCDLNKWTDAQKREIGEIVAEQDCLVSTAALVYLDLSTIDYLCGMFASKRAEGRVIVNFLNPFELEKADATKQILLRHFDLVGSRATKHRRMSPFEQENYGGEDWALLEIWTLARRPHGPVPGLGAFGGLIEPSAESETTRVAREYYDSADADNFYYEVWGGEDLHLGWYESPNESIKQASVRAVEKLAARVALTADSVVVDLGAGYGGSARVLARTYGCRVICLNLSREENRKNRQKNLAAGLGSRVAVVDGSFEKIPLPDQSASVVWSQDALLHAGDRMAVLREVHRVLKPGGHFVFTDPMRTDECPTEALAPILSRLHLSDLGSPGYYVAAAKELGWTDGGYVDAAGMLVTHYTKVAEATAQERPRLLKDHLVSEAYLDRMSGGLRRWIDGGKAGHLTWGSFLFTRPA